MRPPFGTALVMAALVGTAAPAQEPAPAAQVTVHADRPGPVVDRHVFSQFAEHLGHGIYGGIWVGRGSRIPNDDGYRRDVLAALKAIRVPAVRWPGGCFGDEYHWRDGIGPAARRPVKVNTNWGGVNEDNAFGTHEYMGFVERLGADAYVSTNVGTGTAAEANQWVEYMTAPAGTTGLTRERAKNGHAAPWKVAYLGIGNELWGCGGNARAEHAPDLTNQYVQFTKSANGPMLHLAVGPHDDQYDWTETMMRLSAKYIDGLSLHYYTLPTSDWKHKGAALGFPEHEWATTMQRTLKIDEFIAKHAAIMDKYDPDKKVMLAVDEWGTWYDPTPGTNPGFLQQQNSLRDAVVAGLNLNIFTHHADRVKLAAIAQMVNVLQAMLLTDGPRMVKTPTYHVFELYLPWQGATALPVELSSPWYHQDEVAVPAVSASAVRDQAGQVHLGLVNLDPHRAMPVSVALAGGTAGGGVAGRIVTANAMDAHNDFDHPDAVAPQPFTGAQLSGGAVTATLPPMSVVVLDLR